MIRFAIISVAITVFMLVVRPFGLSVDTPEAFMIVLGLAPLNFALMLLLHSVDFGKGWIRAALIAGTIIAANVIYLSVLSGDRPDINLSVKVIIIASLAMAAVSLWTRERSLAQEVMELRARPNVKYNQPITLRGESDREILRLDPKALCYVKADGNYVQVYFIRDGAMANRMLRTTLKTVLAASPNGLLQLCHRSYAVNLNAAEQIIMRGGQMDISFSDGSKIPVSRSFRVAIKQSVTA